MRCVIKALGGIHGRKGGNIPPPSSLQPLLSPPPSFNYSSQPRALSP